MGGLVPHHFGELDDPARSLVRGDGLAAFFIWKDAFASYSVAYYFSLNEYTTLGSNFYLPRHWRLLEGMLAMAGLLAFAWSTGVLFTLAQDFQTRRIQWLEQRHRQGTTRPTSARDQTSDSAAS
jgi:hypothetical protein